MRYDEFIGEVQHRAQLDSRETALSATRAPLETLSGRIKPGEAETSARSCPARSAATSRRSSVSNSPPPPPESLLQRDLRCRCCRKTRWVEKRGGGELESRQRTCEIEIGIESRDSYPVRPRPFGSWLPRRRLRYRPISFPWGACSNSCRR
ncbi:DUF2267 domain-containing protein [Halomontanus rarus]|uniref:DUF2267 domain-containing protein n=1 Tax=Halomontanus rarus TaxID=3034020 RepID=UPI001F617159